MVNLGCERLCRYYLSPRAVNTELLASCESFILEPLCPGTITTLQCTSKNTGGPILAAQWNFLNMNPCGYNISETSCASPYNYICGDYLSAAVQRRSIYIYIYTLAITADPSINGLSIQFVINNSIVGNATVRMLSKCMMLLTF